MKKQVQQWALSLFSFGVMPRCLFVLLFAFVFNQTLVSQTTISSITVSNISSCTNGTYTADIRVQTSSSFGVTLTVSGSTLVNGNITAFIASGQVAVVRTGVVFTGNGAAISLTASLSNGNMLTNSNAGTAPRCTLPVELLDFNGSPSVQGNLLTWTTANEVNNKGFQVERLAPPTHQRGKNWEALGFTTANNKSSTYQFTDATPPLGAGGLSYYRLRQIDNDGKETLSKVISIQTNGTKGKLTVYPNPVSNLLTVENTDLSRDHREGDTFQILNLLGQQVLTGKTPSGGRGLDVSALPQGSYVLKVGAEQVKFVKQ